MQSKRACCCLFTSLPLNLIVHSAAFYSIFSSVPGPDADAAEFSASTSVPGGDILVLYSTTSFLTVMTDFLRGLDLAHPTALKFGAIGSTVSSLT
jgi:hypothetical protein